MAKKVKQTVKLQIAAGAATPAPPVGTILGPIGINMGDFCSKFNETTKDRAGELIPVVLSVYEDRSFTFTLKQEPVPQMIKKAASINKGSSKNVIKKVGSITKQQVRDIAGKKLEDLNTNDLGQAERIVEGTARSMGVEVK